MNRLRIFIFLFCAIALVAQSAKALEGTVEYHPLHSEIAGDKELSVYLPPGYKDSQLAYPIVYALHGAGANVSNRSFFGGYVGTPGFVPIQDIADDLIIRGQINPMIIVSPTFPERITTSPNDIWASHFFQDIVPYVDRNFRTITQRERRGIFGVSRGGGDSAVLAFRRPDLFSVVGLSAGVSFNYNTAIRDYNASEYPIRFWIWHGRNDIYVSFSISENLIRFLEDDGLEYVLVAEDAGHVECVSEPVMIGLITYFSAVFGGPQVAVDECGKLAEKWARIKLRE